MTWLKPATWLKRLWTWINPMRGHPLAARLLSLVGVVVLWWGALDPSGWAITGGAVLLVAGGVGQYVDAGRSPGQDPFDMFRVVWGPAWLGAGVSLIFYGQVEAVEGASFMGALLTALGLSAGVTEWRRSRWPGPWRGPVLLLLGIVAFVVGLTFFTPDRPIWALVAGGGLLLLGPIGVSVTSEDALRGRIPLGLSPTVQTPRTFLLVGAALATLGLVLLTVGPARLHLLLIGAVIAFGLLFLMAVTAPADIVVGALIAAVIVGATTAGEQALEDRYGADAGEQVVVALGDSYISGEGAQKYFEGTSVKGVNECRRAPTAYAPRLLADGAFGAVGATDLVFLACSGARAAHLYEVAQGADDDTPRSADDGMDRRQLYQLAHLARLETLDELQIKMLLVSIGGNDAGFGAIGTACAAPGNCHETPLAAQWKDELDEEVAQKIDAAYFAIAQAVAGRFPVVVVPYPVPLTPGGCRDSLLSPGEHNYLVSFVEELDAVIASKADKYGFLYAEPMETALGSGESDPDGLRLCDPNDPGVNSVSLASVTGQIEHRINPANWLHNSFHPNTDGHHRLAHILSGWLAEQSAMPAPPVPDPVAAPQSSIAAEGARPCELTEGEDRACDEEAADWAVGQVTGLVLANLVPLAIGLLGLWLLVLAVLAVWRLKTDDLTQAWEGR